MNEWKRCLRISSGNLPGVGGTQPLPRPCGDVPCSTLSRLTAQTGGRHEHTHRNTTHKKRNEPLFRSMSATSQSSAKTKQTFLHLLHPVMPPSVCPDPPILFPFSGACSVDHPFSLLNVQFPLLNCILTLPYKHVQACTVGKKRKKEEKKNHLTPQTTAVFLSSTTAKPLKEQSVSSSPPSHPSAACMGFLAPSQHQTRSQ